MEARSQKMSLWTTPSITEDIRKIAKEEGISVNELVNRILKYVVEKEVERNGK